MDLLKVKTSMVLISSPEHEMLKVSYCDRSVSVVRPAASTICFKSLLLIHSGPVDLKLGRKHRGDVDKNS